MQTTPSATDKAAPKTTGAPAFTRDGHTARGDTVHLEGRFGPLLPPGESDVDQTALQSCPETDGRELVRRVDLTFAITSGLAGDVRIVPPTTSLNEEEGAEEVRNLNFVVAAPEGTSCHKGLAEEPGFGIDLGMMQPSERRTLSVWVVLIDAITPADPNPSPAQLKAQEWDMTYPEILVDDVLAIGGGAVSVTE